MVNTNNANLNFQDFSTCNYKLHWSYSNFFRHLFVCNELNNLKTDALIMELGAANSHYEEYMKTNFNKDIKINKFDYIKSDGVDILDITQPLPFDDNSIDCIIFTEVIEHLSLEDGKNVLVEIARVLTKSGKLLFSTPTPIKEIEDKVWPTDHEFEYSLKEITALLNKNFVINKEMPWSVTEREYNGLLKGDNFISMLYCKLKDNVPEGLIRAIIGIICDTNKSRQIIMSCKPRGQGIK